MNQIEITTGKYQIPEGNYDLLEVLGPNSKSTSVKGMVSEVEVPASGIQLRFLTSGGKIEALPSVWITSKDPTMPPTIKTRPAASPKIVDFLKKRQKLVPHQQVMDQFMPKEVEHLYAVDPLPTEVSVIDQIAAIHPAIKTRLEEEIVTNESDTNDGGRAGERIDGELPAIVQPVEQQAASDGPSVSGSVLNDLPPVGAGDSGQQGTV